ncbi:diguanylate cyclase [Gayadomonas joobiniege]|uniref:diguanylate cyclase n=1 Tax=Gayadomonas joobiniege TaxID=1234606 RepID=UPI00138AC8A1|nr:diguanylate cyclase [Gayadomonas joobiniege]
MKLNQFWKKRSLKFWLASGMLLTILPFVTSVVLGYFFFHGKVFNPLANVAEEQKAILLPLTEIQLSFWHVSESVIDFAVKPEDKYVEQYRALTVRLNNELQNLKHNMQLTFPDKKRLESDLKIVEEDWLRVQNSAHALIASSKQVQSPLVISDEVIQFESEIDRLGNDLATLYRDLANINENSYYTAMHALQHFEYMSLVAIILSILFGIVGIFVINISLVNSLNKLSVGAQKFAAGESNADVKVQIPHELAGVANTFNQMKEKISEQREALKEAALKDGLTGVYNRRHFDQSTEDCIKNAHLKQHSLALLLLDIDYFKRLNDEYGHQCGDYTLKVVAKTVLKESGLQNIVCRYGGEEFAVLIPQSSENYAVETAERIRQAISDADIIHQEVTITTTVSIGIALYPEHGRNLEKLIKCADIALYQAKENGRNQVQIYRAP